MTLKIFFLIIIALSGIYCIWFQCQKDDIKGVILSIVGTMAIGIFVNYISDWLLSGSIYPAPSVSTTSIEDQETNLNNGNLDTDSLGDIPTSTQQVEPVFDNSESISYVDTLEDVTQKEFIDGCLTEEGQKHEYRYVASTSGTYGFYSDLSAGGKIRIQISGENGETIDYGTNTLVISLESGKTYILSVECLNSFCEYIINIGVPIATTDITGETSVAGSITYPNQEDQYRYTAPISGTYCFNTELNAGSEVYVGILGENGKLIDSRTNLLIIDLEAGKTYILDVEYKDSICNYIVSIGVPNAIEDITGNQTISGNITYKSQNDRYKYTVYYGGIYRFDVNLSSGSEVRVRISGENGNSLNDGINGLTMELEEGKTYILSIEYRNGPCSYTVGIGVPNAVTDITGSQSVVGSITYQDQEDQYYYTAPISGTYRFDTELSAGAEVQIRISGANGNSLNYGTNALTMELEAGKIYILSVEYKNGICDYKMYVGVPNPIIDITGSEYISGNITYQDQKDKYYYTALTNGRYCFNTNLSAGGEVRVRISGENGNSLNSGIDSLDINLEAGKTYILSVEYKSTPCLYEVSIVIESDYN